MATHLLVGICLILMGTIMFFIYLNKELKKPKRKNAKREKTRKRYKEIFENEW